MVGWLLAACPLNKLLPVGTLHAYRVLEGTLPLETSDGVTKNCTPLHTTVLIELMLGFGSTVITSQKAAPTQSPDFGVTRKEAVC